MNGQLNVRTYISLMEPIADNPLGIVGWTENSRVDYATFFAETPDNGELWIHDTAIPNLGRKRSVLKDLLRRNVRIKATIIHPLSFTCYARSREMIGYFDVDSEQEEESDFDLAAFKFVIFQNLKCYKYLHTVAREIGTGGVEVYLYSTLPSMPIYVSLHPDGTGRIYYSHFLSSASDFSYYILLEHATDKKNVLWRNMTSWVRNKFRTSQLIDLGILGNENYEGDAHSVLLREIYQHYPIEGGGELLIRSNHEDFNQVPKLTARDTDVLRAIEQNPSGSYKELADRLDISPGNFYNRIATLKLEFAIDGQAGTAEIIAAARRYGLL